MSTQGTGGWARFQDLVFSDFARYRTEPPTWIGVATRCLTLPGMVASLFLRAQQCLYDAGHERLANSLRTLSNVVIGMDILPGMTIGRGLLLAHPNGVTIGAGLTIGDNVSFAGGVTCAMRHPVPNVEQEYATICDGAILGAHAVLVGGVTVGKHALVGANSVVLSDVPDYAVVMGVPARQVGTREEVPVG